MSSKKPPDFVALFRAKLDKQALKRAIVKFFVAGMILLDVGFCVLVLGATSTVAIYVGITILLLGATPAFVIAGVLTRRKNKSIRNIGELS